MKIKLIAILLVLISLDLLIENRATIFYSTTLTGPCDGYEYVGKYIPEDGSFGCSASCCVYNSLTGYGNIYAQTSHDYPNPHCRFCFVNSNSYQHGPSCFNYCNCIKATNLPTNNKKFDMEANLADGTWVPSYCQGFCYRFFLTPLEEKKIACCYKGGVLKVISFLGFQITYCSSISSPAIATESQDK